MTIQPIGSASVALYITPADLKEHGLTPAGLTLERALAITQTAFHEAGITLEGSIEIEAYPDACGVLVFAHVRAPERAWFSFDELEPVVAAARDLPAPRPDAALLWWEDRWWLSLGAGEEQAIALPMSLGLVNCQSRIRPSVACVKRIGVFSCWKIIAPAPVTV